LETGKVWENDDCNERTPIRHPQIASNQISVKAVSGAIIMENVPQNARVEIYNLKGKRLRSNNPENPENHGSDKGRVYSENQQCRISCGGEVT
jgi:hypothetical protein